MMFNKQKIDTHFVSEIDKRLVEFDNTHANSPAQQAEIKKYERIYRLRDKPTHEVERKNMWE